MSFSFSSLSLYNTCPFAYKLSYIDKVKPVRSTALVKGSNVHSILEKYPEIQEKEYKYNEKCCLMNFRSALKLDLKQF